MAKITGAQCLADMLQGYGVTHVFMVPAVLRRTFAEMERRTKIKRIHTHGEKSAAYMADGYARASGRPGVPETATRNAWRTMSGKRATSSTVALNLVTGSKAGTSSTSW